jgi:hypothetical protein
MINTFDSIFTLEQKIAQFYARKSRMLDRLHGPVNEDGNREPDENSIAWEVGILNRRIDDFTYTLQPEFDLLAEEESELGQMVSVIEGSLEGMTQSLAILKQPFQNNETVFRTRFNTAVAIGAQFSGWVVWRYVWGAAESSPQIVTGTLTNPAWWSVLNPINKDDGLREIVFCQNSETDENGNFPWQFARRNENNIDRDFTLTTNADNEIADSVFANLPDVDSPGNITGSANVIHIRSARTGGTWGLRMSFPAVTVEQGKKYMLDFELWVESATQMNYDINTGGSATNLTDPRRLFWNGAGMVQGRAVQEQTGRWERHRIVIDSTFTRDDIEAPQSQLEAFQIRLWGASSEGAARSFEGFIKNISIHEFEEVPEEAPIPFMTVMERNPGTGTGSWTFYPMARDRINFAPARIPITSGISRPLLIEHLAPEESSWFSEFIGSNIDSIYTLGSEINEFTDRKIRLRGRLFGELNQEGSFDATPDSIAGENQVLRDKISEYTAVLQPEFDDLLAEEMKLLSQIADIEGVIDGMNQSLNSLRSGMELEEILSNPGLNTVTGIPITGNLITFNNNLTRDTWADAIDGIPRSAHMIFTGPTWFPQLQVTDDCFDDQGRIHVRLVVNRQRGGNNGSWIVFPRNNSRFEPHRVPVINHVLSPLQPNSLADILIYTADEEEFTYQDGEMNE